MLEITLTVLVLALLVERFVSERAHQAETRHLLNAVQARTPQEFVMMEKAVEPRKDPEPVREVIYPVGA